MRTITMNEAEELGMVSITRDVNRETEADIIKSMEGALAEAGCAWVETTSTGIKVQAYRKKSALNTITE